MAIPIPVYRRSVLERAHSLLANDQLFESKSGIVLRLIISDLIQDLTRAERANDILTAEVLRLHDALRVLDSDFVEP